jgi:single-strand DNA-binding protein
MTTEGTVTAVFESQKFDSGFEKREFVVTTKGEYPQPIKFELLKDNVNKVGQNHIGKETIVSFDIRGREWDGKYFNNLVAWKVDFPDMGNSGRPPLETSTEEDSF